MNTKVMITPVIVILVVSVFSTGVIVKPAAAPTIAAAGLTYKGIAYTSYAPNEYASAESRASLDALKSTGANYVSVLVTQYVVGPRSNTIFPDPDLTPTDAAVTDAIKDIHARGMGVLLKPQLDCDYKLCGGESDMAPTNPTKWFASYTTFINHYARIAQANGVELFCVGCEYSQLDTSHYYSNWRSVISGVRTNYKGPLTYGADYPTYKRIPFWGLLDYVGIDAYFPLSNAKTPSVADLVAAWSPHVNEIAAWQATVHKPVLFPEIGYRSIDYAAQDPGNWQGTGVYNAKAQANCYEAALQVFANKPWFAGMFWWSWFPNPNAGGAGNTDYTPQHKPAQDVLTAHWMPGKGTAPVASSPAVSGQGANSLDLFAKGTNGSLYDKHWGGTAWWPSTSLGGQLTSDPAATSRNTNGLTVFVRGTDGGIWYRDYVGGSWGPWTSIGGQIPAGTGPAACSWGGGRLDVFARGTNGSLYQKTYTTTSAWSGWESLGGQLTSGPGATSRNTNGITVFVRGIDGGIWYRDYVGSSWGTWTSIGGQTHAGTGPAVSSWGGGRLDVFVQGTNTSLYHKWYTGTSWSTNWESLGGTLTSSPAAISPANNLIDAFVRGNDNFFWEKTYIGSWSDWMSLGGL